MIARQCSLTATSRYANSPNHAGLDWCPRDYAIAMWMTDVELADSRLCELRTLP